MSRRRKKYPERPRWFWAVLRIKGRCRTLGCRAAGVEPKKRPGVKVGPFLELYRTDRCLVAEGRKFDFASWRIEYVPSER